MRDFNFELRPSDIIAQSNAAIERIRARKEMLQEAYNSARAYIEHVEADELNSMGYQNIKMKMMDFQKVIDGLRLADGLDMVDYGNLKWAVRTENLIGPDIEIVVLSAVDEINRLTSRINEYNITIARGCYCGSQEAMGLPPGIVDCSCIINTRARRDNAISMRIVQENIRDFWLNKAARFDEIEASTRSLFNCSESVRREAVNGIEIVTRAAEKLPNRYNSTELSEWRTQILEEIENVEEAIMAALEERGLTDKVLQEMERLGYSYFDILALWDSLETWGKPEFALDLREAELRAMRDTVFASLSDYDFENIVTFILEGLSIIIDLWPQVVEFTWLDALAGYRNPISDILFLTCGIFYGVDVVVRRRILQAIHGNNGFAPEDLQGVLDNLDINYIMLQWLYSGTTLGFVNTAAIMQEIDKRDYQNQFASPINNAVKNIFKKILPKVEFGVEFEAEILSTTIKDLEGILKELTGGVDTEFGLEFFTGR